VKGARYRACAVIESFDTQPDGEPNHRFVFQDLGDFTTSEDADQKAIQWARAWVDGNANSELREGD